MCSSDLSSFQMSADPFYTYDNTHWICSSTATSLIFMHIYSLHAVMNPATFLELPSNSCGLATSICILGCTNAAAHSIPPNPAWAMIVCSAASCSCCCCTTCSRLMSCQLIVYGVWWWWWCRWWGWGWWLFLGQKNQSCARLSFQLVPYLWNLCRW